MTQNSTTKIAFSILITAIIVGGGVYMWQHDEKDENSKVTKKVTTQEVNNTKNTITLESVKKDNYFRIKTSALTYPLRLAIYSANAKEDKVTSCSKGYFKGDFTLGLADANNNIVNTISLGNMEISSEGIYVKSIEGVEGSTEVALGLVEEYGGCNNNSFHFYSIKDGKLQAANFPDTKSNILPAHSIKDIDFELGGFGVKIYDNSKAKWINKAYSWNQATGQLK